MIYTVKGFSVIDDTEIVFFFFSLKFPCFLYNPANVVSLISSSSSLSKPSWDILKFLIHTMLKPGVQDFKYDEMSATVHWLAHSLVLLFLGIGMKIDLFQFCGHFWVFQICWHMNAKSWWHPPLGIWVVLLEFHHIHLALLTAVLLRDHLPLHSRMSGFGWLTTPQQVSSSLIYFYTVFSVYSFHLFLISSASTRSLQSLHFFPLLCPFLGWNAPWCFQFSWRDL